MFGMAFITQLKHVSQYNKLLFIFSFGKIFYCNFHAAWVGVVCVQNNSIVAGFNEL